MKKINTFALVITFITTSFSAHAGDPLTCVNVGTRSEGWSLEGNFIGYADCANKAQECVNQGTRSEGFAVFEKVDVTFLGYANCGSDQITKPECTNTGTRSEGWLINGKLTYANCADKVTECINTGTRSEGWVAYTKKDSEFLVYANCAAHSISE